MRKRRVNALAKMLIWTVVLAAGATGQTAWAQRWTRTLAVSEKGGPSLELRFGVHPDATNGIDMQLGEAEVPPLPPVGAFDTRFTGDDMGNGLFLDLRKSSTTVEHTLTISFQRASAGDITLSWDAEQMTQATTNAHIRDRFGGVVFDEIDMRTQGQLVITNPAITSVNLVFTSSALEEGSDDQPSTDLPEGDDQPPTDLPEGDDQPSTDLPEGDDQPSTDLPEGDDQPSTDLPGSDDQPPTDLPTSISLDFDLASGDQQQRVLNSTDRLFHLQLHIYNAPEVSGWSATIEYDPEQVRFVPNSFQPSDFIPGLVALVNEEQGQVTVGGTLLGSDASASGSGSAGFVTFEILQSFTGRTDLIVSAISLRTTDRETLKQVTRSIATFVGQPVLAITLDFDMTEGDQQERVKFQVSPGQIHRVQLNIQHAPEISGWSATIEYDPRQLRYLPDSFRPSDFIPGLVSLVDEKEDFVVVGGSVLGTQAKNSGDGSLGFLSFEVLEEFEEQTAIRIPEITLRRIDGTTQKEALDTWATFLSAEDGGATAVEEEISKLPTSIRLAQNYPNPFNQSTTIPYQLARSGPVQLAIFDLSGQRVKNLLRTFQYPGFYQARWNGLNDMGQQVSTGVYLVCLRTKSFSQARKVLLIK